MEIKIDSSYLKVRERIVWTPIRGVPIFLDSMSNEEFSSTWRMLRDYQIKFPASHGGRSRSMWKDIFMLEAIRRKRGSTFKLFI
jgi:hypothetical protein